MMYHRPEKEQTEFSPKSYSWVKKVTFLLSIGSFLTLCYLNGVASPEPETPTPAASAETSEPAAAAETNTQPQLPAGAPPELGLPAQVNLDADSPATKTDQSNRNEVGETPKIAAPAEEESKPATPVAIPKNQVILDAEKTMAEDDPSLLNAYNLVPKDTGVYVDLAREIEISERERKKIELLKKRGANISSIESELEGKLQQVNQLQGAVGQATKNLSGDIQKLEENNPNLKLLVTLYESLSADQAAELLKRLPVPVSLKMMQMMNPKKASKILAAMDPRTGADLSQRLLRSGVSTKENPQEGKL